MKFFKILLLSTFLFPLSCRSIAPEQHEKGILKVEERPRPPVESKLNVATQTRDARPIPILRGEKADIFPPSWRQEAIDIQGKAPSEKEFKAAYSIVTKALQKYPLAILEENLKRVYILSELEFFGAKAGGTNSLEVLYLTKRSIQEGYTAEWVESAFHHEFSSILLRNFGNEIKLEWPKNLDKSFSYGTGGVNAIHANKASKVWDDKLNARGFLHQYATSSMEEDFNSFLDFLFSGDPKFWRRVERYPKLKAKCDLVIEFYYQLNPMFTRDYFMSF